MESRAETVRKIKELDPVCVVLAEPLSKERAKKDVVSFGVMKNNIDERKVFFPTETIGKMLAGVWYKVSRMLPDMKHLFETSIPAWSEPEYQMEGHKKRPNVLGYHNYVNKFIDDTGTYFIRFAVREISPAKKGESRSLSDDHIHYTAISEVSVYKENGDSSKRVPERPGLNEKPPFLDRKLQQYFDSVKEKTDPWKLR